MDIRPGIGIVIEAHAHGERHVAEIGAKETLQRLSGTVDGSAIVDFVRKVVL